MLRRKIGNDPVVENWTELATEGIVRWSTLLILLNFTSRLNRQKQHFSEFRTVEKHLLLVFLLCHLKVFLDGKVANFVRLFVDVDSDFVQDMRHVLQIDQREVVKLGCDLVEADAEIGVVLFQ